MPKNHPDTTHDNLPDWINQLRSQSWQIEILIAGSTVYSLFYLSDYMQGLFYSVYPGIDFTLTKTLLLFGIYLVSRILLIGFIGNLIIRAVWLAYLGINFAFPKGIKFDNLRNNSESKEILRKQPTILDRVSRLERFSKLSYSISILLAIFMTSVVISTIVIHVALEQIGLGNFIYEAMFSYTLAIFIAIVQLGVIDRMFLSKHSKRPIINKIKKYLSVGLEYITLSFLFRREFLALKSNVNRYAFIGIIVFILGLSSFITAYQIGKFWPYGTIEISVLDDREYYDIKYDPTRSIYNYDTNVNEEKSVLRASIQSDIVKDRYLRLFVTSWMEFDEKLKDGFDKYDYPLDYVAKTNEDFFDTRSRADSIFNLVMNDIFSVEIDKQTLFNLRWRNTSHPKSLNRGYITYIDIENLSHEEHFLTLYVNYFGEENKLTKRRWKDIVFWKD